MSDATPDPLMELMQAVSTIMILIDEDALLCDEERGEECQAAVTALHQTHSKVLATLRALSQAAR